MASPSELTLDYNPNPNPKPFIDQPESTQKLQDFLARLEEERLKIEAFKRELPLCMQLLNNATETYKRQLETYQGNNNQGLHDFVPIKVDETNSPSVQSEKANWMETAQLWIPSSNNNPSTKLGLDTKQRCGGGAFLPFSKEKISKGPELALVSSKDAEVEEKKSCEGIVGKSGANHEEQGKGNEGQNTQRKARRCWSPDLHRRFVNALQMLGGSQGDHSS